MPRGIYVRKNGKVGITVTKGVNPVQEIANEVVALKLKAKKDKENNSDIDYLRMENEQMKEHLSYTHRVLTDRVETIIMLLENLKRSL